MIEKTKLSLWDFFVSALSGFAIMLSILIHCLIKGKIKLEEIFNSHPSLITVGSILTFILAGLLLEPLANYITKLLTTCPFKYAKLFRFKNWDDEIKSFERKACEYVPEGIEGSTYEYCKNWLLLNTIDNSYMPFLSKYGFYRSMFFIFLLNGICTLIIYKCSSSKTVLISSSMFVMALVYLHRCGDFYRHMSATVYLQFISLFNKKTVQSEN